MLFHRPLSMLMVCCLSISLAACLESSKKPPSVQYLGDLVPIDVAPTYEIVNVSTEEQITTYKDLLTTVTDTEMKAQP